MQQMSRLPQVPPCRVAGEMVEVWHHFPAVHIRNCVTKWWGISIIHYSSCVIYEGIEVSFGYDISVSSLTILTVGIY